MTATPEGYELVYRRAALVFLATLQTKLRRQIIKKIERLKTDPFPSICKQIVGMSDGDVPVYRIRCGKHRVLYSVRERTVTILEVDHRKDIYK